jgi:hypothetical protein
MTLFPTLGLPTRAIFFSRVWVGENAGGLPSPTVGSRAAAGVEEEEAASGGGASGGMSGRYVWSIWSSRRGKF